MEMAPANNASELSVSIAESRFRSLMRTDDFGFNLVENPTVLQLLRLNRTKLTIDRTDMISG